MCGSKFTLGYKFFPNSLILIVCNDENEYKKSRVYEIKLVRKQFTSEKKSTSKGSSSSGKLEMKFKVISMWNYDIWLSLIVKNSSLDRLVIMFTVYFNFLCNDNTHSIRWNTIRLQLGHNAFFPEIGAMILTSFRKFKCNTRMFNWG